MLDSMTIAASGLQASSLWLSSTASNIANMNTPDYQPTAVAQSASSAGGVNARLVPTSPTDLGTQMVGQLEASADYRANLAVIGIASRAYKYMIDAIR